KKTKETDLAGTVPVSNMRIIDPAEIPVTPDRGHRALTLVLSVGFGLCGGVGLAFFRHFMDRTLKTPEDVMRYLGLATLGLVPDLRKLNRQLSLLTSPKKTFLLRGPSDAQKGNKKELVSSYHPLSLIAESYRLIRTGIRFSMAGAPPRTLVVTSSLP